MRRLRRKLVQPGMKLAKLREGIIDWCVRRRTALEWTLWGEIAVEKLWRLVVEMVARLQKLS